MSDAEPSRVPGDLPLPRVWEGEVESHVRAYRRGESRDEHGAWLVQKIRPGIAAVFFNQLPSPEAAGDLTQETLLRVFEKIGEYRFEAPFTAWVRQVTVNRLRNYWRDDKARGKHYREEPFEMLVEASDSGPLTVENPAVQQRPEAEANILRSDLRRVLGAALRNLPPGMRRCLLLFAHDFTYREIADILGVTLNTVRSQISNGYRRLRPALGPYLQRHAAGSRSDSQGGRDGE